MIYCHFLTRLLIFLLNKNYKIMLMGWGPILCFSFFLLKKKINNCANSNRAGEAWCYRNSDTALIGPVWGLILNRPQRTPADFGPYLKKSNKTNPRLGQGGGLNLKRNYYIVPFDFWLQLST